MSREIKFRAWIKTAKQMIENNQIMHIEFKGGDSWLGFWFTDEDADGPCQRLGDLKLSELELMQFTGLLDKNGKEIYEGDICRGTGKPFRVNFYDGCFVGVDTKTEKPKSRIVLRIKNNNGTTIWKVIGNIYENPELLEASDEKSKG